MFCNVFNFFETKDEEVNLELFLSCSCCISENQEEAEGLDWKNPKDFCYFFPRFVLTLVGALGVLFLIIELPTDLGSGAILFAG